MCQTNEILNTLTSPAQHSACPTVNSAQRSHPVRSLPRKKYEKRITKKQARIKKIEIKQNQTLAPKINRTNKIPNKIETKFFLNQNKIEFFKSK